MKLLSLRPPMRDEERIWRHPLGYWFARSMNGEMVHAVQGSENDKLHRYHAMSACGTELTHPRVPYYHKLPKLTCVRCKKWAEKNGWPTEAVLDK